MSTTIDNRIVEMRFDNKQFESGVATSMSTLDKLKQKLNLSKSSKGLEDIGRAAKNVDMSGLNRGIETVQARFSALQVVGVTALANITNSAVNTGKRMVSALTIDPVKTGFNEYETKMNSIQTIMSNTASKGTTMAEVTKVIDELNTYADKTIYNFAEMTRNIGTFTAAGVGLKDSASAIQGIANLAAASGSNSQQASTAMYQLSQALAAGTVKLMDWNSVVNAGMGGEKFQLALKETAREMGIGVDVMIEKNGSFRESLQEGWLSADVLNTTLKKFTIEGAKEYADSMVASGKYTREQADALLKEAQAMDDAATKVKTFTQLWDTLKEAAQSGWGKTWEIIIGDFEEAKELFSGLSKFFGGFIDRMSDNRNNLLEGALANNPFSKLAERIEKVTGVTEKMTEATKNYGDIVDKVIGGEFGNGAKRFEALTEAGYDWAYVQNLVNEKLGDSTRHATEYKESQEELSKTQKTTIEDLVKMSDAQLKNLGFTKSEVEAFRELEAQSRKTGIPINELMKDMDQLNGRTLLLNSFKNVGQGLVTVLSSIGKAWREIFPPMTSTQLYNIIAALHKFSTYAKVSDETADNLKRTFKGLFAALDIVTTIIGGGFKLAFKGLSKILSAFDMDILDLTANLGDAIVKFRDFLFNNEIINKGFDLLAAGIIAVAKAVKELYNAFKNIPMVQYFIEYIKEAFADLKDIDLVEVGKNIIEGLKNGLEDGISSVPSILIEIGKKILSAIKDVLGIHSPSTEMHEVGENVIEGLLNGMASGIGKIVEFVKGLASKIRETFDDVDWGKVFAAGASVAMILMVKKIVDIIGSIASPLEGLGEMFEGVGEVLQKSAKGIGKVLKSFSKVLTGFSWNLKAKAIRSLTVSLVMLVGAIAVLTLLDPKEMWNAVAIVGALAAILIGLSFATDKMSQAAVRIDKNGASIGGLKGSLVAIGAAILLLGLTVKMVGSLNPEQAKQGFLGLAGLIVAIGAVFLAFGKFITPQAAVGIQYAGGMLLKMSIALGIMVGVIKLIGMLSEDELIQGAKAMAGFTVFVAALALATKLAGPQVDKFGGMLLKISITMGIMVGVVKLISLLSEEEMKKGALAMGAFAVFVAALVGITRFAGPQVPKIGGVLLAMSTSIMILAGVAKIISGMSWGDMGKAVVGIAGLTLVMLMLTKMIKAVGPDVPKMALTLLAMSVSIGILAGVAVILSLISLGGLAKGIVAVTLLGGVMSAMILATRGASDVKGSLMAMSIAIGVMAASVAALSMIDGIKLAGATIALSTLMGMFALIAKSAGMMGTVMGPLIVMTVAVGMLGGLIYMIAKLQIESVMGAVISLSALLLAMSASMRIISKAGLIAPTALIAMGVMTLVVGGLALIIGLLAKCNVGSTLEIAASLSMLLIALSASVAILSLVGPAAVGAIAGIGVMAGLIVGIGGLMVAIGALVTHFPSIEEFLNKGIPILEKIGYGLGSFFGNIISGFSTGVTSGLPIIGANLSMFMTNLQPFVAGAKTIDETALSGITSLTKMFALLAGANILEKVSEWVTGSSSMDTFSTGLNSFADAIVSFSGKVKGNIDEGSVTAAANAGLMLAKMQTMVSGSGGVFQFFTGEKDLSTFGTQLVAFGQAIVDFSNKVKGNVNEEAVTAAANAGTLMATLQSKVQPSGGVVQFFTGEKNFETFGNQLVAFGSAITAFSKKVSGEGAINEEAITAASNAGSIMTALQSKLVGTGGVIQFFTGEKNLSVFGAQLIAFGDAIVGFSKKVSAEGAINEEAITAAANAGTLMTTLQSKVVPNGGVVEFFTGKRGLDTFGTQIVAFGQAIVDFSKKVKGNVDEESVTAAANAGRVMATLQKAIPEDKWLDGKVTLDDFGSDISSFGGYIADYSKKVADIDAGAISSSITQANRLVELAKRLVDLDTSGIDSFRVVKTVGKAIKDYAGQVADINANLVSSSISSAKRLIGLINSTAGIDTSGVSKFKVDSIGRAMKSYSESVAGLDAGIVSTSISAIQKLIRVINEMAGLDTSGVASFQTAINNLGKVSLSGVISAFSGASEKLATVGSSMMDGLVRGMKTKQPAMVTTATTIISTMSRSITTQAVPFKTAGTTLMTNLITGISSQKTKLSTSLVSSVTSAVSNIRSQYSTFSGAGSYLAEGFANGIALKAYLAEQKAKAMAQAAAKAIEDTLDIQSPSKVTEQDGKWFGEGFSNGIDESTETVAEASTKLGESANDALVGSIADGADKVKSAQDLVGEKLVDSVEETQDKLDNIKERDIAAENAYWQKLLVSRQNGADAVKYKTMDMAKFEEDVLEQTLKVWDNYVNELDNKTDSIMNQRNLFDALPEKDDDVTKDELTENLASQIREYEKFSQVIGDLNGRIAEGGLKDFVNTLGVESLSELQAINSMTDSELSNYVSMYEQKYALAKTSALTQLEGLKLETESKLSNLYGGVAIDASTFASTFDGSMDSIKQYVQSSLNNSGLANSIGSNLAEGVAVGITNAVGFTSTAAAGMIDTTLDEMKKKAEIHSPSGLFEREIGSRLAEGVAVGMTSMLSEISNVITGMVNSTIARFGESYNEFVRIGAYVAEGFKEGILSKADEIAEAAAAIAREAMEAVEEELDEHSPSKEMYKLGAFAGTGFVNGLRSYADRSYKAGAEMADSTRKGLSRAINKVYAIVNGDMEMQPTIRPVLDLSSVRSGVGAIDGMFGENRNLGVFSNIDAIRALSENGNVIGMGDVVSAINKLRKDLGGKENNSYSVGSITYDDGSNVSEAVKSLVRAAKVGRRV